MIVFEYITFILCVILVGLTTWFFSSKFYEKQLLSLKTENLELKAKIGLNENIINTVKAEFSKIAQESLKNQQEQLLSVHSTDLKTKMDLFKAEENILVFVFISTWISIPITASKFILFSHLFYC